MLKANVVNITGEKVQLTLEDGQVLAVPASSVEGTPKVGMDAVVIVACLGSEDAGRTKIAQDLLNELLKA